MNVRIPIVFCFDANYAEYAAVATYSAYQNSQSPLKIYWICPHSDVEKATVLQRQLETLAIKVSSLGVSVSRFSEWKEFSHITRGAYLRLLIADLVEEEKAIYLDCDTIVLSDLTHLYQTDLGQSMLGGVATTRGAIGSRVPRDKNDPYINTGVLLLNLEGLRRDAFLRKSEQIYAAHRDAIAWADQCIINKYAEGRKLILDEKWNRRVYPNEIKEAEFKRIVSEGRTAIVHFVGSIKPWQKWCNPCVSDFWWEYAKQLKLRDLRAQEMTSIDQALSLAMVLDLNERYQESSSLKGSVINHLLDYLKGKQQ